MAEYEPSTTTMRPLLTLKAMAVEPSVSCLGSETQGHILDYRASISILVTGLFYLLIR